ncbi:ABC transporter ATP-binding protein [Streptomyces sp. NPDC021096]|uniref:ABC transporter ATP-binding protein n=1 Tax=Streptomyces sp. NPDC021096 TaxID=3154792 RepID=UPI0033E5D18E
MLIRLLRARLRPYGRAVALLLALQLVQIMGVLVLPTLGAAVIDNGVLKADAGYVRGVGAFMLAVALAQVAAAIGAALLASRTAMGLGRDLRSAVFRRVLDFSARELGRFGTPSLITRTVNDVQQVQTLVLQALGVAVAAPVLCVGSVVLALSQDVPLSLLLVALVVVISAVFGVGLSRMGPWYDRMQSRVDRVNQLLREQITGVRVVRAFVREAHERERFARTNAELAALSLRVARLMALLFPVMTLVMNAFIVFLLWFGGHRVDDGSMRLGALTAFLGYLGLIVMSVVLLTLVFVAAPRAKTSAQRIQEVLGTEPSVVAPREPVAAPVPGAAGHLELRAVEFRYPGAEEPVLSDVDLTARPGQTVAILGSTGSGKTTLLNLVLRQFDATGGTVLVDGVDVRSYDPGALSRAVGFVPQKPLLFSGTVASNLRFGDPDATDEELWQALETAQARDFVERMPQGLESVVAQGGTNLSGGQRQRLAIARTLLRKPGIYLFDDCLSALDYTTDAALRAALAPEVAGATVVVVAQRISTVRDADRIVVLDAGRVVAAGTHAELMRDSLTYREIALSQLTEEEAAA